jgi:threonine dehydrogenase-like Zn-dependent dehydrogenase
MKAAVLYEPKYLKIEEIERPSVGKDEVLIQVKKAGICGTDIGVFKGEHQPVELPRILGHEYSGVIAQLGSKVQGLSEEDRVVSEASWGCGSCSYCLAGRPDKCQKRRALGRTVDGAFAEFVRVPASIVHKLPEGVSHEEGQLVVNLACTIRAVRRSQIVFGDHVVIIGSGQAALLLLQVTKLSGAGRVTMVGGERQRRLELAAELGADEVIQARSEEGQQRMEALAKDGAVDTVIEASGSPNQLERSMQLVKQGGKVVIFSIFSEKVKPLDANLLYHKELNLCGSRGGAGCYGVALDLLQKKRVRIKPMISHDFPLENVDEGMRAMLERDPSVVRITVTP